jgi:hypothetical protein
MKNRHWIVLSEDLRMPGKIHVNAWKDPSYTISTIQKGVQDDLFISCISYEPRTTGSLEKLAENYKANSALFLLNKRFQELMKVIEAKEKIRDLLNSHSYFSKWEYVTSALENPLEAIIGIDKIIKKNLGKKPKLNITLDITTFPRGELLTVIYYLSHLIQKVVIRIIYISPDKYGDPLSEGYGGSMLLPFFEGPTTFGKKTALLILTGFEYDRATSLIDDLEPSALMIGRPIPGTSEKFKDASERIVSRISMTRKITKKIYDIPANDPFLCAERVQEIIKANSREYDFYLATLGTKLQALGAYLAYEEAQNFRIVYPLPLAYNTDDYSYGCDKIFEFTLS